MHNKQDEKKYTPFIKRNYVSSYKTQMLTFWSDLQGTHRNSNKYHSIDE